jgi:hypothetical protein
MFWLPLAPLPPAVGTKKAKRDRRQGSPHSRVLLQAWASWAMIKFVLMVNKQGQTRLSTYYEWMNIPERVALEVSGDGALSFAA